MFKNKILGPLSVASFIFVTYLPLIFLDDDFLFYYIKEDGVVEYLGAIFFLLSFVVILRLLVKKRKIKLKLFLKNNWFFLLLGFFFLLCFLEEISWGQRIFNVETPTEFGKINSQMETNLHNIVIFTGNETALTNNSMLIKLLDVTILFHLFWFLYCILIPFFSMVNQTFFNFLQRIRFPIASFRYGILFAVNFVISKIFQHYFTIVSHDAIEIKESNSAFLFLIVTIILSSTSRMENDID